MSATDPVGPGGMTARAWTGPALALTSAALFGASTPAAKPLLAAVDPWLLAGLLYLGSGLGLFVIRSGRRLYRPTAAAEAAIGARDWPWLAAAVLCGGVMGPILLMVGLASAPASGAALLLNLETVFTALLAWFAFGQNVDRRVAFGMLAIVAGAAVLAWPGSLPSGAAAAGHWTGPLAVAGACLAWALDNNLTRKVALADPLQIAMLKGLVAGAVNVGLATMHGAILPSGATVALAGLVGLLGYGVSLVLFILALRHLGAARTGAYYAVAPFVGAALAILALGEPAGWRVTTGGLLMAAGMWLHLTERHEHEHEHAPDVHSHAHVHDLHHRHAHAAGDPPGEPHVHRHRHIRLRHRHPHYPDAHHQHGH
jgi:drug/metabolite transporter (DMT)-like permease